MEGACYTWIDSGMRLSSFSLPAHKRGSALCCSNGGTMALFQTTVWQGEQAGEEKVWKEGKNAGTRYE